MKQHSSDSDSEFEKRKFFKSPPKPRKQLKRKATKTTKTPSVASVSGSSDNDLEQRKKSKPTPATQISPNQLQNAVTEAAANAASTAKPNEPHPFILGLNDWPLPGARKSRPIPIAIDANRPGPTPPRKLPPRKALHKLTASDQPTNQLNITSFFGSETPRRRPIISAETLRVALESAPIVISDDDNDDTPEVIINLDSSSADEDERGQRVALHIGQEQPVAKMPINGDLQQPSTSGLNSNAARPCHSNAAQRHRQPPSPRPRTFGDFVPKSSSDSETQRRTGFERPGISGYARGQNNQRPPANTNDNPPDHFGCYAVKKRTAPTSNSSDCSDSDWKPKNKNRKTASKTGSTSQQQNVPNNKSARKRTRTVPTPNSSDRSDSDVEPMKKARKQNKKHRPEKAASAKREKPAGKTTSFKRTKNVKPEKQDNQREFTSVKMKLNTLLAEDDKDELKALITANVMKATRIASLTSLLLLTKVNDFIDDHQFFNANATHIVEDCFFEVLAPIEGSGKVRIQKYPQYYSQQFEEELNNHNIARPTNAKMGNMFKYLVQGYTSNFKVNICTHGRTRVFNFLKTIPNSTKSQRKNTVAYLFNSKSKNRPHAELLASLRNLDARYTNWSRGALSKIKENWFRYVPLFLRIQRIVYQYNMAHAAEWLAEDEELKKMKKKLKVKRKYPRVRRMNIVPLTKYKRQHIRIDTEALLRLVKELKNCPKIRNDYGNWRQYTFNEFLREEDFFWRKYFDMGKIDEICAKTDNKTDFLRQIHTDGVSVSVVYESPLKEPIDVEKKIDRIRTNYNNNKYKYRCAIDVGYNTYIAAVRTTIKTRKEVNFKIKSKRYHRKTKFNLRNKRRVGLAGSFEKLTAAHLNSFDVVPSPTGANYWDYVRHRLQFWERGLAVYTTERYANITFNKYLHIQREMDRMVTKLTNRGPTLFLIGGAEFNPNSPIKGHLRCPGVRKLIKILRKYRECDYLFVDEYKTSQHCGVCISSFDPATKSDRFKVCNNCAVTAPLIPQAPVIVTDTPKRQRKRRRREGLVDYKKSKYIHSSDEPRRNVIWQRDITACRLIDYKGLNALLNNELDERLKRPRRVSADEYSADDEDSDKEECLLREEAPTKIIWS